MPKTIFGTTEKSNFILNMKAQTLQRWINALLLLCIIIPHIGNFVIVALNVTTHNANATSSFLGTFLYVTGFSCILFFIIVVLKKEVFFKENPSYFMILAMAVWAFASYYSVVISVNSGSSALSPENASELVNTALFGELGRYEGVLSLFAYFGIFLLATAVSSTKSVRITLDILVGAGIIQGIIAVLQHIPNFDFLTTYADLPTVALRDVMLSSGICDSPIFFGSFLTLVSGISIVGAVYEKNILRARIYGIASVLFLLTGLFTSSIVPIIGIGCTIIVLLVIAAVNRKKSGSVHFEGGLLKSSAARLGVLAAALAVTFALVFIIQGLYFRDKAIAYYDAYYRLFIVLSYSVVNKETLYGLAWSRSLDFIREYPLFGVGPDCFAKMQLFDEVLVNNSIDKSYNEYLYIACTRGIPSLLFYLVFAGYLIKRLFGGMKQFFADREKWYRPALLAAVLAYLVQGVFSASSITVAPFFWLLAGLTCAKKLDKEEIPPLAKRKPRTTK